MSRLRVENFGPISMSYAATTDWGFVNFRLVPVLIGEQHRQEQCSEFQVGFL